MISRMAIVGAVIAALLLWLVPFPVPDWAVVGFLPVLISLDLSETVTGVLARRVGPAANAEVSEPRRVRGATYRSDCTSSVLRTMDDSAP